MTETVPTDVPAHVTISVADRSAGIAVECSRCRVQEWLYLTVVMAQPLAIALAVDRHRGCVGRSGGTD